jgi:hypothetical protein
MYELNDAVFSAYTHMHELLEERKEEVFIFAALILWVAVRSTFFYFFCLKVAYWL